MGQHSKLAARLQGLVDVPEGQVLVLDPGDDEGSCDQVAASLDLGKCLMVANLKAATTRGNTSMVLRRRQSHI